MRIHFLVLLLLCITTSSYAGYVPKCVNGLSQTIYGDALGKDCFDWSWAAGRKWDACDPVHSGKHSFSFTPTNWDGLYINLGHPINPTHDSHISFWVHGGGMAGQKMAVRLTKNKVALAREYPLYGANSVLVGCNDIRPTNWTQGVISLHDVDPISYDGIQFVAQGQNCSKPVFIDTVEVLLRCDSDPHVKTLPTCACPSESCVTIAVKETNNTWTQDNCEYTQYDVILKNVAGKAITRIDFVADKFDCRSDEDIWGVQNVAHGRWGIPTYMGGLTKGGEYKFGCVAKRGTAGFKVVYVEYS
ncbi:hypothetical protein DFA_03204 [Cavenderia fasciculata]|uniref:Carbohydrate binding domain-containing protein n=1 Tax=Cavenderia fasciculata TaxID=261658 RepID=F4PGX5_CACFS|nr:uncharacterized protein DFA_03204 [Cavenderia fasciculata]EGG24959.1 hypothetical protein DFA_03204 [Cavenderia fasciculata]|eukprot:XP_004362810.1 hypothetical protein DFA_03204 [Cavenderia fasciculata]